MSLRDRIDQSDGGSLVIFGALLVFAAILRGSIASVAGFGIGSILTPVFSWHFDFKTAVAAVSIPHVWLAGALSGVFGGLVGNQGGLRSASMLGFGLNKQASWRPPPAIALAVDAARMPVYFAAERERIGFAWPWILASTVGVIIGTVAGERVLRRIPEPIFYKVVGGTLAVIGLALIVRAR